MARPKPWEVSDELWAVIEPLLPRKQRRFRHPGRRRIDDRKTLQGILFVLYTGIQWEFLPQELGFGSGPTCWRRLAEWQAAGVWRQLQQVLLDKLRAADQLDFSRATVDASHVQAKRGRSSGKVGPSPVDRGRPGSKHHVLTDASGTPLRVSLTGGNRHDVTQLLGAGAQRADDPGQTRTATGVSPQPVCRPRLRPRQTPPIAPRASHHPAHRPARTSPRFRARPDAVGRRSRDRLAARPPQTPHPLGNPRRHAQRLPPTRPLHDPRPQTPRIRTLK